MRPLPFIIFGSLIYACTSQPKIDYQNKIDTTSVVDDRTKDTTKILVAALPGKFDSTDILLFPIGFVDLTERREYGKISLSSGSSSSQIISGYFRDDGLSGNFTNIVFQDNNGVYKKLTDKKINIAEVHFLRSVYKKTKLAYLIYTVYDRDTNHDGELNYSDISALYLSKLDGSEFKKVTKELHHVNDYRLIKDENRIYFRTQEDVNKDGDLDKRDKFHYYKIDFNTSNYVVSEYNPLILFE